MQLGAALISAFAYPHSTSTSKLVFSYGFKQTPRYYCEEAVETTNFRLSPLPTYFIPEPGSLQGYREYIATLPTTDRWRGLGTKGP
jgi:hypothetical protein